MDQRSMRSNVSHAETGHDGQRTRQTRLMPRQTTRVRCVHLYNVVCLGTKRHRPYTRQARVRSISIPTLTRIITGRTTRLHGDTRVRICRGICTHLQNPKGQVRRGRTDIISRRLRLRPLLFTVLRRLVNNVLHHGVRATRVNFCAGVFLSSYQLIDRLPLLVQRRRCVVSTQYRLAYVRRTGSLAHTYGGYRRAGWRLAVGGWHTDRDEAGLTYIVPDMTIGIFSGPGRRSDMTWLAVAALFPLFLSPSKFS